MLENIFLLAHLYLCMVGSYASLSVCLSACHWNKIDQTIIHILVTTGATVMLLNKFLFEGKQGIYFTWPTEGL